MVNARDTLTAQVADAYEHLYDLVSLRVHPLTELLVPDPALQRKERAWQLHHILLQAIEDLNPGPQAPAFSHEWRRHRLMVFRYVDGLDPQSVADRLSISRRQYYREHEAALGAIADILWDRCQAHSPAPAPSMPDRAPADHLGLLRLEAARMAQAHRHARVADVLAGVASLLQDRLQQRRVTLVWELPGDLPDAAMDQGLLRQMLLGMLGYLAERTEEARIHVLGWAGTTAVELALRVDPPSALGPTTPDVVQERVTTLHDLAALSGARVEPVYREEAISGFHVQLPGGRQPLVLVIDDNEDVLALFQRYLGLHQYQVVTAQAGAQALALAHRLRPQFITLDLMMPGQDGWEILQTLLNRPDTRHIPIIVCSVLRERELALSLGATAFLEKPVSEQALLAVLQALH